MKNRLLLLLFLLPLFLIGISNSHDWGDDFSQYLLQARNMVSGSPQMNEELVFATGELPFAIVAYPVGFPILLAPIYACFNLFIPPYLIVITALLILTAILFFDYLKRYFDNKYSFLIAIFFAYNIISLVLKKEILSEFPFTLILFAILLLIKSGKRKSFLIAGILSGFLLSIRLSGLVILPALIVWQLIMNRQFSFRKKLLDCALFCGLSITVFYLLNVALFEINIRNFLGFYAQQFESHRMMLPSNFFTFFDKTAEAIFPPFRSTFWTILFFIIIATGYFKKIKEGGLAEWFFAFYLALIVFYPYASSGLRFIYPVLPFIIIYFVTGIQTLISFISSKNNSFQLITIIFSISIFFSFRMYFSLPKPDGPYSKDAHAAFNFITANTPKNSVILFSRARALNLYAERNSTSLVQQKSEQENLDILKKLNCEYVLYADERSGAFNQTIQDFLLINRSEYDTLFKEDRFLLLKMKTSNLQ